MPLTVVVRSRIGNSADREDDAPLSLTFDGERVVIGRGSGSDVRLPDASVSQRHATIRISGSEYAIVDERSTNGTLVGGVRLLPLTPRIVRSGDRVRVGRVWLELIVGAHAATPDLGMATRDLALALVRRAMDTAGQDPIPKVRVVEGPDLGREIRLTEEGRAYSVGRAETCDLALADADSSREHAIVIRRQLTITIRDCGSRNGLWLGEDWVESGREVVWRPTTMLRLGQTVLALDEPVTQMLAELESAADEPVPEDAPGELGTPLAPTPPSSLPPSERAGTAPVALRPEAPTTSEEGAAPTRRRVWTLTDVLIVVLAIAVIGASAAGLVWVLR